MFASSYLVEGKLLDLMMTEMELATTCVKYLSAACYDRLIGEAQIRHFTSLGHYSFIDYASVHWINHVRAHVAAITTTDQAQLFIPLLQTFLDQHWNTTQELARESAKTENRPSLQRDLSILEKSSPEIFHKLVHLSRDGTLVESQHSNVIRSSPGTLTFTDLGMVIHRVRAAMESMYAAATGSGKEELEIYYGTRCFKCAEEDCAYFSEGFASRQSRDEHQKRHTRFPCSEPECYKGKVGCSSEQALKEHMENDHGLGPSATNSPHAANRRLKFPAFRNKDGIPTNCPFSSQASQQSPVAQVLGTSSAGRGPETANVETRQTKNVSDWSVDSNIKVPRALDVDLVHTLQVGGNGGPPCCVNFSRDGLMLAAGLNYSAQVFDTLSGREVATLRHTAEGAGEQAYVQALMFSPDGLYLVTAGEDMVLVASLPLVMSIYIKP